MLIDTHSHINFNNFRSDGDDVIQRTLEENTWMINVGADYKTSKRALDYANKYERGVYAAAGLHPMHAHAFHAQSDDYDFETRGEEFNYEMYDKLVQFEKIVAVGEIGLDYYHIEGAENISEIKNRQKEIFVQQLLIARRRDLPVIIHCRQAHDDMLAILKDFRREYKELIPKEKSWGVLHCFSGDEDLAWQYFGLGMIVSFTGLITFSRQWDELIRKLPADKFMVETDCPFMTPEPYRGQRNEPLFVKYVAMRIAEIRKTSLEKISDLTTENARNFFNI